MTNFDVAELQVGATKLMSGGSNAIVASLDVIHGNLSFRQVVNDSALAWEACVSGLGLEDVLVLDKPKNGAVDLAIRLRAVSFYGHVADPQARARSLVVVKMSAVSALSFLSCLAFGLAKLAMPSDAEEDRIPTILSLCSVIRKGLARRDLLNRGWTDAQLADGSTLVNLLSAADVNRFAEKHLSAFLPCISRDARQLRNHEAKDVNATPGATAIAQPPRKAAHVPQGGLSPIQLLADAPIFENPSVRQQAQDVLLDMEDDDAVDPAPKPEKPKVFFLSLFLAC